MQGIKREHWMKKGEIVLAHGVPATLQVVVEALTDLGKVVLKMYVKRNGSMSLFPIDPREVSELAV